VWQLTGREATGTRVAAWIGRVAAVALVVYTLVRGYVDGWTYDLIIAGIVAWFLWEGAGAALTHAGHTARISRLDARALLDPADEVPADAPRLPVDLKGAELVHAMAAQPAEAYVLVERDGSVAGILWASRVDEAYRSAT
jgi:hypothetical protein